MNYPFDYKFVSLAGFIVLAVGIIATTGALQLVLVAGLVGLGIWTFIQHQRAEHD